MGAEAVEVITSSTDPCTHPSKDEDEYCTVCGADLLAGGDDDEDERIETHTKHLPSTVEAWRNRTFGNRPVPARYTVQPCEVCGTPFTPKRSDQLCCTKACKAKKYRTHIAKEASGAGGDVGLLQKARDRELARIEAEAVVLDQEAADERELARIATERAAMWTKRAAEKRAEGVRVKARPLAKKARPSKPGATMAWYCTKVCGQGPWADHAEPDACPCGGNLLYCDRATPPLGQAKWRGGVRRHDGKPGVQR